MGFATILWHIIYICVYIYITQDEIVGKMVIYNETLGGPAHFQMSVGYGFVLITPIVR